VQLVGLPFPVARVIVVCERSAYGESVFLEDKEGDIGVQGSERAGKWQVELGEKGIGQG